MPPTLIHLDKLRLYRHACPKGTGPHARVHIEYDATFHDAVPVGDELRVGGKVSERYREARARPMCISTWSCARAEDDRLLISYRDTVILSYKEDARHDAAIEGRLGAALGAARDDARAHALVRRRAADRRA